MARPRIAGYVSSPAGVRGTVGPDFGTNATDVGLPVTTEVKVTGALEIVLTTRGSHEEYTNDGSALTSW